MSKKNEKPAIKAGEYEILQQFRDVYKNVMYAPGDIVAFTGTRAKEIINKLGEGWIKLLDAKKEPEMDQTTKPEQE